MIQIIETFPSEIDCHKRWDGTKFTELHRATYQYKVQCLAPIIGKLVLTTIPLETALSANLEIPFTTEQLVVRPCANLSFDTLCFNIEATNENDDRLFAVVALDTKERTAFVTMTVTGLVSDSLLSA